MPFGIGDPPAPTETKYGPAIQVNAKDGTHWVKYPLGPDGKPTGMPIDVTQEVAGVPVITAPVKPTGQPTATSDSTNALNAARTAALGQPKDAPTATSDSQNNANDSRAAYYDSRVELLSSPEYVAGLKAKNGQTEANTRKIYDEISNADDLEPAKKQQLLAQAELAVAHAGIAPSTILKNTASANKLDAQTAIMMGKQWPTVQPQIEAIHNNTIMTPEQKQAAIDGVIDQAVQEAQTGMNAEQRANQQRYQESTAVNQANSRAQTASSFMGNTFDTVGKLASQMAPGKGDIAANGFMAMMQMAPNFLQTMGGAPVQLHPNAGNMPVTPGQKSQIMGLVSQGMPAGQAIATVGQQAGAYMAPSGGPPPSPGDYGVTRSGPQNAAQVQPFNAAAGQSNVISQMANAVPTMAGPSLDPSMYM